MSVKISELPSLETLADNDILAGVDTSEDTTSKITLEKIKNYTTEDVYDKEEVDDTIDALQTQIDSLSTIYNAFPTTSDEGESMTLDDTAEVTFKKLDLKGNTSQYSTTGKNKLAYSLLSLKTLNGVGTWNNNVYTHNGVTFTINEDLSVTVNGTASSNAILYLNTSADMLEPNTEYIASGVTNAQATDCRMQTNIDGTMYSMVYSSPVTFTTPSTISNYIQTYFVVLSGKSITNKTIYPMIRLSSVSDATYEPYTNGTSPNPDYPQDIHVVSGDNTIKIYGKNLFDDYRITSNTTRGVTVSQDNNGVKLNGTYDKVADVNLWLSESTNGAYNNLTLLKANTTYTFSARLLSGSISNTDFNCNISSRTADDDKTFTWNYQTTPYSNGLWKITFTTGSSEVYISAIRFTLTTAKNVVFNNAIIQIQVEQSSTVSDYEPYNSKIYKLSLGVSNIWDTSKLIDGFLPSSGSYPTTNVSYPNAKYMLVSLNAGQSITIGNTSDVSTKGRIRYIDKNTNQVVGSVITQGATANDYYISTGNFGSGFVDGTITAKKDFILGLMTIDSTYTIDADITYGSSLQYINENPIELCKVGIYQDYIKKSTGKNLFSGNFSQFDNQGGTGSTYAYFKLPDDGEEYTISIIVKNTFTASRQLYLGFTGNGGDANNGYTWVMSANKDQVLNAGLIASKTSSTLRFVSLYSNSEQALNEIINNIYVQLEKRKVASDYEPYGKNEWYLKKYTKTLILNGTRTWQKQDTWSAVGNKTNAFYIGKPTDLLTSQPCYCDYEKYVETNTIVNVDEYGISYSASLILRMPKSITDGDAFKTWLSNNNVKIIYVLSIPTYTKITDNTLIGQLEVLQDATSYDSQTNISQENNDKPFIINAEAILSLKNILD